MRSSRVSSYRTAHCERVQVDVLDYATCRRLHHHDASLPYCHRQQLPQLCIFHHDTFIFWSPAASTSDTPRISAGSRIMNTRYLPPDLTLECRIIRKCFCFNRVRSQLPLIIFTALHGMQTRLEMRILSVRPSVCLSVTRMNCDKT